LPPLFGWLLFPLLVIDVFGLLACLALANVTASGPAQRTLAYSVAILTDMDTYLDERYETLLQEAHQDSEATIALPGFPLDVSIAAPELTDGDREHFRALVLKRSADKLHDEGAGAFRDEREAEVRAGSIQGLVRLGIDLLRPTPHAIFFSLTILAAGIALLLTLAAALSISPSRRVPVVTSGVFAGAALFLIGAVALRFALRVAADSTDDEMTREFLRLAQESDWAAIRNGIIVSIGAAITLVTSLLLDRVAATNGTKPLLQ
jgi:hypothetical protein